MLDYILLIAGLGLLVVGGDMLVKGSVGLAQRFGISPLIIGLTIVAFGTSAPELFISVQAALAGSPGIAIGNVVGSNIANVLLVMGVPALIAASRCDAHGVQRNIVVMIGFTIIFMGMLWDGTVSRIDGVILFFLLILFLYNQFHNAVKEANGEESMAEEIADEVGSTPTAMPAILGLIAAGLLALPFGADLTVDAASSIARAWNVSDDAIGLTIVAIGTSLPELATSVMATLRSSQSIAIGNVVGSNVFNIGAIMGIAPVIAPMTVGERIISADMWVMLACAILLAAFAHWRVTIGKGVGLAMLGVYSVFVASAFMV